MMRMGTSKRPNLSSLDLQKQFVAEKRVARSSAQKIKFVNDEVNESDSRENVRISSKERKTKVSKNAQTLDSRKQNVGEKRVTRSSVRINKVLSKELSGSDFDSDIGDREVKESGDENCKRKLKIGEKRKRNKVEEEFEIVQGWSREQELALQTAYFKVKPITPRFWKKVTRMVPGKSAAECLDKIHSDHLTPSPPPTLSRPNKKITSPILLSASKLPTPAGLKTKRLRPSGRNILAAQKTIRQLFEKQQEEDKDYEADYFAIFEQTINPSPLNFQEGTPFSSPAQKQGSSILTRSIEMSSSANKAGFVSPPVLKQVKNKALHEKYIDQLHRRDAKRKAESLTNEKHKHIQEQTSLLEVNSVKFAKDALLFQAQDAINQFRGLQYGTNDDSDDNDDDDDISHSDEDEL